jgi:putative ABC transport system substrate-binding protein
MRRRQFITLLGGAAAAWPAAVRAQQPALPVVGFLFAGSKESTFMPPLRKGLSEMGFVEGRNVAFEYRWAEDQYDRLPALAAELVSRRVAVISAIGAVVAALAAKAATTTIPIVFGIGEDPVETGLVASLSHPGGNVTGNAIMNGQLTAKRLELLHALLPAATRFAVLVNPGNPLTVAAVTSDAQAGLRPLVDRSRCLPPAPMTRSIRPSRASYSSGPRRSWSDPAPCSWAVVRKLPRWPRVTRCLQSILHVNLSKPPGWWATGQDSNRQGGIYLGRIPKGEKPADLPVMEPTKFEFVINLQTAKAIGIEVPPTLLAQADEVIE